MEQEYKYMVCTRCFTFNQENYVVDALNGFVKQETGFPVVYVIVDDDSTNLWHTRRILITVMLSLRAIKPTGIVFSQSCSSTRIIIRRKKRKHRI